MRLVHNWRRVLRNAWSLRINILIALTSGIDAAIAYVADGRWWWSLAVFIASVVASMARVVAQGAVSGDE